MFIMLLIIWSAVFIVGIGLYLHRVYSTFRIQRVKNSRIFPLLGNVKRILFRQEDFTKHIERLYYEFPNERFIGRYEFLKAQVIVRDIELVKEITTKDFEHFTDHCLFVSEDIDPLFGRNLFSLKGQEWKDMRSTLSPAFTSAKIKMMVPFIMEISEQMTKELMNRINEAEAEYIDVEGKDLTGRFTNDVIATCAFGLKVDSLADDQNHFFIMAKAVSAITFKQLLKIFGFVICPKIMKFFNIMLFLQEPRNFFKSVVLNAIRDREERHIIRPDMIHLLMEAQKGKLSHDNKSKNDESAGFATAEESALGRNKVNRVWTEDDIVAQTILFFIAGFETVSSAMAFLLHELALNPEIQERLAQEIRETETKTGGDINYNTIQNMVYMDMVISELLRLWPPVIALDRICVKDYNLGKPNDNVEKDFIIRKGTGIGVPVWAFHHDPQFFPNPMKFDPERFSDENKHNIRPFTYMPFGLGPRNCIGSRFALTEIKIMAYRLIQHLELSPCEKTCIPVKLVKESFNLKIEGGHWVRMKVRT